MILKPKFFKAYELVDRDTYLIFGEDSFKFLRPELLVLIDDVRLFFNAPVTINNWKDSGQFMWRGFRTNACTDGAAMSAHRVGAAVDINVSGKTPQEVYTTILANPWAFKMLRRMEHIASTPGWNHLDVIEHDQPGIKIIKP